MMTLLDHPIIYGTQKYVPSINIYFEAGKSVSQKKNSLALSLTHERISVCFPKYLDFLKM